MTDGNHGNPRDPIDCGAWDDRIPDYLEGDLAAPDRDRFERHLSTCVSCTRVLEDLREVTAQAASLAVDEPPSVDLWPGVARRLRPRTVLRWSQRVRGTAQTLWNHPAWAAAATLALAITAAAVWSTTRTPAPPEPTRGSVATAPPSRPAPADRAYDEAVAELRRVIRERLTHDPQVVTVLERNLETLDAAIATYSDALSDQPGDGDLRERLEAARHKKLDLLRRTVALSTDVTN